MRRLVERFVAERTAQEANAQGGITVADIRNLRNDVVGLRYEVVDDHEQSFHLLSQCGKMVYNAPNIIPSKIVLFCT